MRTHGDEPILNAGPSHHLPGSYRRRLRGAVAISASSSTGRPCSGRCLGESTTPSDIDTPNHMRDRPTATENSSSRALEYRRDVECSGPVRLPAFSRVRSDRNARLAARCAMAISHSARRLGPIGSWAGLKSSTVSSRSSRPVTLSPNSPNSPTSSPLSTPRPSMETGR